MDNVPSWYELLLLALAAYRLWRLIALDTIADGLRRKVTRLGDYHGGAQKFPSDYRGRLADFISCPWCLGFWVTVGWWLAWVVFPHAALVAAVPFAISAAVGIVAHFTTE